MLLLITSLVLNIVIISFAIVQFPAVLANCWILINTFFQTLFLWTKFVIVAPWNWLLALPKGCILDHVYNFTDRTCSGFESLTNSVDVYLFRVVDDISTFCNYVRRHVLLDLVHHLRLPSNLEIHSTEVLESMQPEDDPEFEEAVLRVIGSTDRVQFDPAVCPQQSCTLGGVTARMGDPAQKLLPAIPISTTPVSSGVVAKITDASHPNPNEIIIPKVIGAASPNGGEIKHTLTIVRPKHTDSPVKATLVDPLAKPTVRERHLNGRKARFIGRYVRFDLACPTDTVTNRQIATKRIRDIMTELFVTKYDQIKMGSIAVNYVFIPTTWELEGKRQFGSFEAQQLRLEMNAPMWQRQNWLPPWVQDIIPDWIHHLPFMSNWVRSDPVPLN
jgi:hypothetical protein